MFFTKFQHFLQINIPNLNIHITTKSIILYLHLMLIFQRFLTIDTLTLFIIYFLINIMRRLMSQLGIFMPQFLILFQQVIIFLFQTIVLCQQLLNQSDMLFTLLILFFHLFACLVWDVSYYELQIECQQLLDKLVERRRKIMICIDIGNKQTTIYDGKNSLTKLTTVKLLPHDQIQIGLPRSIKHVVYDIVALLGIKYQDQQFTKHAKFYFTDFWKNKWGKIDIGATFQEGFSTQTKCLITQTLLALFLRKLLIQFLSITNPSLTLATLLSNTKFYITLSGKSDHPSRYALKQACQIAGIQSPVFIYSTHAIICSFYQQFCKALQEMQEICLLEFGDRGAMVSVYRVHSFQDRIVEVLECRGIRKGGYHLTKVLAEYIIQQIKQEKGIDISRHNSYMSLLHSQSESVKIIAVESEQKQAHMRIPNLPDDSTFGRIITQKLLASIIQKDVEQVIVLFKDVYKKYKQIKTVLISGGSCNLGGFQQKIADIVGKGKKVRRVGKEEIGKGVFQMQKQEIVLFDISDSQYEVIGQENFHRKLMDIGQNIPERRQVKAKFPAGELQFNLKVLQNGIKIGHFILDSRPNQLQFGLNFQIDRNKLIGLHVKTQKGKIDLITNFEGIASEQVINQAKRISQYKL